MDKSKADIARECVAIQRERGRIEADLIAVTRVRTFAFEAGEIVLATIYPDDPKECTIERPFSRKQIEEELSRGSLLTTGTSCVCYPVKHLEIVELIRK